ncbi:hypothetical protein [Rhodovulum sp. ES.010]|uniref:hypothetical protein n=1 Tax=Rhodovulum sp. ES.010 TaxID=1882821 RepID=UPI0011150666|nr:hypothetical protein [Rhodovulum sp. ES.010]
MNGLTSAGERRPTKTNRIRRKPGVFGARSAYALIYRISVMGETISNPTDQWFFERERIRLARISRETKLSYSGDMPARRREPENIIL